jgi:hypothetical protein
MGGYETRVAWYSTSISKRMGTVQILWPPADGIISERDRRSPDVRRARR